MKLIHVSFVVGTLTNSYFLLKGTLKQDERQREEE